MNIPRPLLTLVVIIIVLGVLSCGAGVFRGVREATATPAPTPTASPRPLTDGLVNAPVPPSDVSVSTPSGGNCSIVGPDIIVTGECLVTVDPQTFRPRVLGLEVMSGLVTVVVRQEIRGSVRSSKPAIVGGIFEVSVAGSSPVLVDVVCTSCSLSVSP